MPPQEIGDPHRREKAERADDKGYDLPAGG
jgi:hypothetical protein